MSSSSSASPFPLASLRCLDDKSPCPAPSYVAVSACIYDLPPKKQNAAAPPESLADFSGAKRLFLSRLPETATKEDVDDALATLPQTRPHAFPLRVVCSKRKDSRKCSAYVLVAPSEQIRHQWYSMLLWSISPFALLKKALSEGASSVDVSVPPAGPLGSTATSTVEFSHVNALYGRDAWGSGAQAGLWAGTVGQGITGVAGVASDAAARALGGVSVVGPALQVIALASSCARMVKAAEAGKEVVRGLHGRLVEAEKRLEEVANVVREALERGRGIEEQSQGFLAKDLMEDVMEALVRCWEALVAVELHMMDGWVGRVWRADMVEALAKLVDEVEERVRMERVTRTILEMKANFRDSIASVREEVATHSKNKDVEMAAISDRVERLEKASDNEGHVYVVDSFSPGFGTVPRLPRRVVRDGCPHLQKLKSSVLSCGSISVTGVGHHSNPDGCESSLEVLSAQGEGGLGKTTACILVAHDPEVRSAFPGGVYFIPFTPDSRDVDVVSALAHIVSDAGGKLLAREIKNLSQSEQVRQAVDISRKWFSKKQILLVADNIWRRGGSSSNRREWAPTLAPIAESSGSAFLFSTRDNLLAAYADESIRFNRLDMRDPLQHEIAQRIFERYAGTSLLVSRDIAETSTHKDWALSGDLTYVAALPSILRVCDGWPLAIESAGAFVRNWTGQWTEILNELSCRLPILRGSEGQDGLEGIWKASISFAEKLSADSEEADNPIFCGVNVNVMRRRFGEKWLTNRIASFAVFDSPRSVPVSALSVQQGISLSQSVAFLRLCAGLGFGKILDEEQIFDSDMPVKKVERGRNQNSMRLDLHDLQFSFVQRLCKSDANAYSLHEYHRELLEQLASFGNNANGVESDENWSNLVELAEDSHVGAREYFSKKLSSHFCKSFSVESRGRGHSFVQNEQDRAWYEKLCRFLCDFRWTQFCGKLFGRQTVLESWCLIVDTFCRRRRTREEGIDERGSILSRGMQEAIRAVLKVLEATPGYLFSSPQAECPLHGRFDTGLAAQLEGRLSVLTFEQLPLENQKDAMAVVEKLQASIKAHSALPRLRPRGKVYAPADEEDRRCVLARYGGHGSLNALAYIDSPGGSLAASACSDGAVRLHDRAGEIVAVVSEEDNPVYDISVRGSASSAKGALLASASWSGTVHLWRIYVSMEQNSNRTWEGDLLPTIKKIPIATINVDEYFLKQSAFPSCVSVSENGNRVAVGFRAKDTSYRQGGDERLYAVGIWTQGSCCTEIYGQDGVNTGCRRHSTCGTDYNQITLLGHEGDLKAMWISRDGKTVVSGSDDGSVRVWWVPIDATTSADIKVAKVELGRGCVWCLAVTMDEKIVYAGTDDGFVFIICPQSGKIRGQLSQGDGEQMNGVYSMELVEYDREEAHRGMISSSKEIHELALKRSESYSRTLFCGRGDGTIEEWVIGEQKPYRKYGKPWNGKGIVMSLTAKVFREGDALGKLHLLSGYGDGRLRKWDTSCTVEACREGMKQSRREVNNGSHLPREGGDIVCALWSPGENYIAFGRKLGSIDLWSVDGESHSSTLFGHEEWVECFDFTLDDKLLCSVDGSTKALVWDTGRKQCMSDLRGTDEGFSSILFVGGRSAQIMTGGIAGSICIWDRKTSTCLHRFEELHSSRLQALSVPLGWEGWAGSRRGVRRDWGRRLVGLDWKKAKKAFSLTCHRSASVPVQKGAGWSSLSKSKFEDSAMGMSRDFSGIRRLWDLHTGDVIEEKFKLKNEDTGLLLSKEFREGLLMVGSEQYREARNFVWEWPRISIDGEECPGAEHVFTGDGQIAGDQVFVSLNRNDFRELMVRVVVTGTPECRCRMRLVCDEEIWLRSIVCRAHHAADGSLSIVVACVDDSLKVIFADVLFAS